jgi:hypothetical protein
VVENLPHYKKVEGLSPANAARTGRKKMTKSGYATDNKMERKKIFFLKSYGKPTSLELKAVYLMLHISLPCLRDAIFLAKMKTEDQVPCFSFTEVNKSYALFVLKLPTLEL